jgi:hypothetical protein
MTTIQLIGDVNGVLNTDKDIDIPLTFALGDIRDITKRNGFFSKTITVPGTANNNELFGYYFDVNISTGTFNINKLQECLVLQDGIPILQDTYLQLISVRKRQNIVNNDDIIEYDVLVKDQVSNFFTTINNKELRDLDFSEFNHNYTSTNIESSFSHTWTDGYKYVFPFRDQPVGVYQNGEIEVVPGLDILDVNTSVRGYFTNELFPAIYMMEYWKKIHEQAGFTYEFVDFDNYLVGADKLLITDNTSTERLLSEINEFVQIEAKIAEEDNVSAFYQFPSESIYSQGTNYNLSLYLSDDIKDLNNKWNSYLESTNTYPALDTTGSITVFPALQVGYSVWESEFILSQANPKINVSLDYEFYIYNSIINNTAFSAEGDPNFRPYFKVTFQVVDELGTVITSQQLQNIYPDVLNDTGGLPPGITKTIFSLATPNTFPILLNSGQPGDLFAFRLFIEPREGKLISGAPLTLRFQDSLNNFTDVTPTLKIKSAKINITYNSVPYNATFPINTVIPSKIKQSDFIKSIVTMYNLYCIVDKDDQNKLIWKRRDQFYDEGPVVDWTNKMDRSQFQEILFLPELSAKKFIFTYKQDNDFANQTYFRATREIYGQQEVIMSSEWVKEISTKELIFSPTPMSWTDLGIPGATLILPYVSSKSGEENVRLLYDGGQQELGIGNSLFLIDVAVNIETSNYAVVINGVTQTNPPSSINILNIPGYTSIYTEISTYPLTTHTSVAYGGSGSLDINFGQCDYYFFSAFQPTQNNLYNLNWKRTMEQLDNSRMLTAYFDLNALDIANLDLSSKIRCMNTYWYINKIIDYNANKKQLTQVELISIDSDVTL